MGEIAIISELTGNQERHPGGHNWPDLEIVIDPTQTEIVDNALYLIQASFWSGPNIKKCRDEGSCIRLMPALATIHSVEIGNLFGKKVPIMGIEFTDSIYKWHLTVHGCVIGLWGGPQ